MRGRMELARRGKQFNGLQTKRPALKNAGRDTCQRATYFLRRNSKPARQSAPPIMLRLPGSGMSTKLGSTLKLSGVKKFSGLSGSLKLNAGSGKSLPQG